MEPQQHNQPNEDNNSNGKCTSNFTCRQSSTRWTPTTDQIRILKDLYYNNGVRSPSADQIQRISARLRQYGKIEGKNVFYWFQNHKARERQKKRFTADVPIHTSSPFSLPGGSSQSTSSPAIGVAQIGNYGSVTMDKTFMDCSISGGNGNGFGFVGSDSYSYSYPYSVLDKTKSMDYYSTIEEEEEYEEIEEQVAERETLPLFPMHGEDINGGFCNFRQSSYYSGGGCYRSDDNSGGSRASLELSLNTYTGRPSGSMI